MSTEPRIAIAGTGSISRAHARAWQAAGARVVGCCDPQRERAEAFVRELGLEAPVVADLDALIALRPDAIDVCTPPWLHAPYARRALEAGLHAVVEKPLAGSLAEFDALVELERRSGRLLIPVLQNRLGDGPRQLRRLREAGLAGRLLHGTIETVWRRGPEYYAAPWRGRHATELGGCLTGLAVHLIDLTLGFAPPVAAVLGHAATLVHAIEVEDTAAALCLTAGGGWLAFTVSVHAQRELSRGLLAYERMQVEFGPDPYGYAAVPWTFTAADPAHQRAVDACLAGLEPDPVPAGSDQLWYRQMRLAVAALRGQGPGGLFASARPSLEVLSAIYASARSGARIDLPLTPAHPNYHRAAP